MEKDTQGIFNEGPNIYPKQPASPLSSSSLAASSNLLTKFDCGPSEETLHTSLMMPCITFLTISWIFVNLVIQEYYENYSNFIDLLSQTGELGQADGIY